MPDAGFALLLDTCAIIYLAEGLPMKPDALARIEQARASSGVLVSPVSAWEVGLMSQAGRRSSALRFHPDAKTWFERVLAAPGIRIAEFDCGIALGSSSLPGELHRDPANRLLVATARQLAIPIVTRDAALLRYAAEGHVEAVGC